MGKGRVWIFIITGIKMRIAVHREGLPIIAGFVAVAALAWWAWPPLGFPGGIIALWSIWFFRDPDRFPPDIPGAIISPADGKLLPIVKAPPPEEMGMGSEPLTRVSIFMNVFNVHVNRVPADGKVEVVHYRAGRFFNASFDKASIHNERQSVRMKTLNGDDIVFVQIAGLIARRIRSTLTVGNDVQAGARFGLIRFGSRLDVYLPDGMEPKLTEGQSMVAGETVIAISGDHKKGNAVS